MSVPPLSRNLGYKPAKVPSNMNSPRSLRFYIFWWCIKVSVKQVYLCCEMLSTEVFPDKRLLAIAGSSRLSGLGFGHRLLGKYERMHRTLTALIRVLFHSSAHLLAWLKAAGCMLEGWLGVILHIFIANFPCLLRQGGRICKTGSLWPKWPQSYFNALHRNSTFRGSGSEHLSALVH